MFAQCRLAVAGVFAILLLAAGCTSTPRGVPAAEGIANFGRITPTLWRGAQPSERGLENLAKLGVVRIINLRMPDDVIPAEASTARRLGVDYENVPLPGLSAPDAMAVARVLALIDSAGGPVFIHCQHGADRTGTIIACYRIRHDGWTADAALAEAKRYGMSEWEFGMKDFVRHFPAVAVSGG